MEKIKHIGWESESPPVQIRKWGVMMENKINEIIDRLNEEKKGGMTSEEYNKFLNPLYHQPDGREEDTTEEIVRSKEDAEEKILGFLLNEQSEEEWRKRFEQDFAILLREDFKMYARPIDNPQNAEGEYPDIGKDLLDFIQQELDKAREEGRRELVKEIREAIREDMNKDWDTEKRHIAEEELKSGGWGWYS